MKKLKYQFFKLIQKGLAYQLTLLFVSVLLLLIMFSFFISFILKQSYKTSLWISFMHLIDSGTITGQEGTPIILTILVCVTLLGIFIWSVVVAILNEGLRNKLDHLRRKIVRVYDTNHVIILGWGDEVPAILEEYNLIGFKTVYILSNQTSEFMSAQISPLKLSLEVIIKQADTLNINTLNLLNMNECKGIICIPENDSYAFKQILALKKVVTESPINVSIMIHDPSVEDIITAICDQKINIYSIIKDDILEKITSQSVAFNGLMPVYNEILSYKGNEFHFIDQYTETESSVKELAYEFFRKSSILVGYEDTNKKTCLHLKDTSIIPIGSRLIVLSMGEGISASIPSSIPTFSPKKSVSTNNVLIIGEENVLEDDLSTNYTKYINTIKTLKLDDVLKQKNKSRYLKECMKGVDQILIFSSSEKQDIDAMAILSLIRHIDPDVKLLTKINTVQNRNLITNEDKDNYDFIVSAKIIGTLMGQVSLDPDILYLITTLLSPEYVEIGIINCDRQGSFEEIYLHYLQEEKTIIGIYRDKVILNPNFDIECFETDKLIAIGDFL